MSKEVESSSLALVKTLDQIQEELCAKQLSYGELLQLTKYLQGRVLTIIDATIENGRNKYIKDLIRDAFRTFLLQGEGVVEKDFDAWSAGVPLIQVEDIVEDIEGAMKFEQPVDNES